jgi:hypothetical protein
MARTGVVGRTAPEQFTYAWRYLRARGQESRVVAEAIGMPEHQMYRRLRGVGYFSLAQARAIARYLRADYSEVFPNDEGVDPRDIAAQRVAEAGPERRHAS